MKSVQISFKSVRIFVTIRGKTWQVQLETAEIRIRTPLKLYVYFRFVSETTDI